MKMKFSSTQFYEIINEVLTACHQVHEENLRKSLSYEDYQFLVKDKIKILNSMK